MKIDKIIFAVDDNPKYEKYWELNSEICKKVLGITPVLFYITNEESDFYESEFGIVKKIKKLENIPSSFQSQIFRIYGTKFFPNEVCITSDIDLITINKNYITNSITEFTNDDFVVYSIDAYDKNRPECVGIYCDPRIVMCYNAGTGRVFNEIFNTERPFNEFVNEVLQVNESTHDCDEIFMGQKIHSFHDQSRIKKLDRGFTTPFICSNRIDRPKDENYFNIYEDDQITSGDIIDIHLSRPYSLHEQKITRLKNLILNNNKEVFLIGCHIENTIQENYLRDLTNNLKKNGKEYFITSHTEVPQEIIKNSVGFLYDPINPKYKTWDLEDFQKFEFESEGFRILSPYLGYGAADYYHVGVIRLIINSLRYLKSTNYEIIHWIEYDALYNRERFDTASVKLEKFDFIFYGVGSQFSFNLNKVSDSFLSMTDNEILIRLKENDYVAEKLIWKGLSVGKVKTELQNEDETNTWNRFSQNFHTVKTNWSLFDVDGKINLFVHNTSETPQTVNLQIKDKNIYFNLPPYNWNLREVTDLGDLGFFKITVGDKILVESDFSIKKNYDNIIGKVNFLQKK